MEQELKPSNKSAVVIIDNDEATRYSLEWLIQPQCYTVLGYESGLRYFDDTAVASSRA